MRLAHHWWSSVQMHLSGLSFYMIKSIETTTKQGDWKEERNFFKTLERKKKQIPHELFLSELIALKSVFNMHGKKLTHFYGRKAAVKMTMKKRENIKKIYSFFKVLKNMWLAFKCKKDYDLIHCLNFVIYCWSENYNWMPISIEKLSKCE